MKTKTWITVRAEFRALHRWEDCPHKAVAFLRDWHRHVFKVEVSLWVGHNNRDEEFFLVQAVLRDALRDWEGKMVDLSCEMFAEKLIQYFTDEGHKVKAVTVSEDGENGATVEVVEGE